MRSPVVERAPAPAGGVTRPAAIASVAMAVPDNVVTNATVAENAGVTEQWIVHRTGVHERRHVSEGERLQDLATAAGRAALEQAGVAAEAVDLVLVATVGADELLPNAAPLVALDLGAHRRRGDGRGRRLHRLPVGAVAGRRPGRVGALRARARDRRGRAEPLRRQGRPRHRGAVRRRRGRGRGGRRQRRRRPDRSHRPVRRTAPVRAAFAPRTRTRSSTCRATTPSRRPSSGSPSPRVEAVEQVGLGLDDIDLFVYHQANARILAAVGERLGLDGARVIDCIDRYGNTSSATLPIALADARERGLLEPGMNVLLAAFGAGFTWGAGVIQWGA